MNRSLLTSFTPQIIDGAMRCGLDIRAVQQTLRTSGSRIVKLRGGSARLSVREARAMEAETGRSIGELALLGIERSATPDKRAANRILLRDTLKLMKTYAATGSPPARRRPVRNLRGSAA